MTSTKAPAGRPLRADAVRNRDRILAAARLAFAERGLEVSLDDVAERAGVGVGTLYRRFPNREALVEALFDERIREQVLRLQAAVAADDAWTALVAVLETTCADLAGDRGLRELLLSTQHGLHQVAAAREQLHPLTAKLVARAKAQGHLREGFEPTDVPVLLLMVSTVGDFAGDVAPELWQRYLRFFIDGIRAGSGSRQLLPPALTPADMEQAMRKPSRTARNRG